MKYSLQRIALILLLLILLPSCALVDKLGFDTYDYMSEPIIGTLDADGEEAHAVENLLSILIMDSPDLPYFDNMSGAIRLYRDAVLTNMLHVEYSKYSGNIPLIERAERAYPEYHITQIIPADDFEATMYRCFGGDIMISNKDSNRFKYLSKVNAYIATVSTDESNLVADVTYISETEKTYHTHFQVVSQSDSSIRSEEYFALIIKRADGSYYIKKLLDVSQDS